MRSLLVFAVCSVSLAVALALGGISAQTITASDIVVSYATPSRVVLREPIIFQFRMENRSSQQVETDLGWDQRGNITVEVVWPDGSTTRPEVERPAQGGVSRVGTVPITAGKVFTQQYLLNDWVTFDQVGTYEIRIGLRSGFRVVGGVATPPPPVYRWRLVVADYDVARLREVCERLVQIAMDESDAGARKDAARALAAVIDVEGVLAMQTLYRATDWHDSIIVEGLRRQGTEFARAALWEMAGLPGEERSALAQDALRRFPERVR